MADRLNIVIRANRGRAKLPSYLRNLEAGLGRPAATIELVALPETDLAFHLFGVARSRAEKECGEPRRICASAASPAELLTSATLILQELPDESAVLFRSDSQFCGAVRTSIREIASRLEQLWIPEHEDVLAGTANGTVGIWCAYDEGFEQHSCRLVVWY